MNLAKKRILIFQQRGWGLTIGHDLAVRLSNCGARLAAVTVKKPTHDFVMSQQDVDYEAVAFVDAPKDDPAGYLDGRDVSLDEVCRELGVDTVWPFVQSLRNHIKSYEDKYYYGFKQNVSDEEIVKYVKAIYLFITDLYEKFPFEGVMLPNFAGIYHIFFYYFAKKRGIPCIAISDTKVQGLYYFCYAYQEEGGKFVKRYEALNSGREESPNAARAEEYIAQFRDSFLVPSCMSDKVERVGLARRCFRSILPFYWALRALLAGKGRASGGLGATIDNKPPRIILRDYFVHRKNLRDTQRFEYAQYNGDEPFAFFPLQFQPEETIDVQSVRQNNQIETARQVAMSLPGDMTLVTKDHPDMVGLRPRSYLEKVARTPNVKLVDYRISSEQLLKDADVVIAPGGTVLAEAAYLRKPAVQLGDLEKTMVLPNVLRQTDYTQLAGTIIEAMEMDTHSPEYERRLVSYVAAMYDIGFEIDYGGLWCGRHRNGLEEFLDIYIAELASALRLEE